jgi:hypothetical protein
VQAVATLKNWRLLRKLRCGTSGITHLVQAVLILHLNVSSGGWTGFAVCGERVLERMMVVSRSGFAAAMRRRWV